MYLRFYPVSMKDDCHLFEISASAISATIYIVNVFCHLFAFDVPTREKDDCQGTRFIESLVR